MMKKIYFLLCMLLLGNGVMWGQRLTSILTEHFAVEKEVPEVASDHTDAPTKNFVSSNLEGWTVEAGKVYNPTTTRYWVGQVTVGMGAPGRCLAGPDAYGAMIANYNATMDSWLISPRLSLLAGKEYTFRFYSRASSGSSPNVFIDVSVGNAANVDNMTTLLTSSPITQTNGWTKYEVTFTPTTNGKYYFGIRGYQTSATARYLALDEVDVNAMLISDAGVTAITAPVSDINLSTASVTITVKNFGEAALSKIPVTYTIDGGTEVTEIIPGPLDLDEEMSYTFKTKADLSVLGNHVIKAYTALAGGVDENASNDATTVTVRNIYGLDAGVTAITAPVTGKNLPSDATVTVTVKNFSEAAMSDIPVTYTLNGGTAVETETIPGPIEPGKEVSYTFTTTADLSLEGDYVIKAYTLVNGDPDATNDATTVTVRNTYGPDAGVTAITSPVSGTNLTNATVTITVKNLGPISLPNVPVTFTVDGGTPVITETVPGPLAPGEEANYTFNTKANLSIAGEYIIKAYTLVSGDANAANDATSITVRNTVCPTIAAPWSESFSASTFPPTDCWSNTSANDRAWKRVATGTYPTCSPYDNDGGMLQYNNYAYLANSKGVLTLPPVAADKSANFSFWMYRDINTANDYVNVYISETSDIAGATPALTVHRACSLTPVVSEAGWYRYSVVVPAGATASALKYISLEGVSAYGNNVYVDKLELSAISEYDASVSAVTAPVSGMSLSNAETVTIKVKNEGAQTLSNIPVTFKVDNAASVATETVAGPIATGEEATYTFSAKADLSAEGDHVIKVYTLLANDANRANDTMVVTINNQICEITTFPYTQGFEDETVTACIQTNTSIALVNNVANYHSGAASCPLYSSYAPSSNVSLTFPQMAETEREKKITYWMKATGPDATWQVGYITAAGDTVFNEAKTVEPGEFTEMTDYVPGDAVQIIIRNTSGQRLFLDDVTIKERGLGIPSVNGNVSVYPTLSKGQITVNTGGKATVRIIGLSGKVLATYESNAVLVVDLPYENGIYFVTVGNEVFKVVLKK